MSAGLFFACEQQHVAIVGARQVPEEIAQSIPTQQRPTVTVTEGTPALKVGRSVKLKVTFSNITEVALTQLLFAAKGVYGNWVLDLTPAELAAGEALVEVHALDAEPSQSWCQRDGRGSGACSQLADDGMSLLLAYAGNEQSLSVPGDTTVTFPPLSGGGGGTTDTCATFTAAKCCAGGPGISVVACYVSPPCKCPDGTKKGPVQKDGTTMCSC
jgi:hypothetical protein